MQKQPKLYLLSFLIFMMLNTLNVWAQIPTGYYDAAEGKTSYDLKTELFFIIDNHTDRGYSALWDLYYTSDDKPNGKVWDMYSDIPGGTPPYEFTFGNDQCGNYSGEGSCYNREHSFPKSWFNDGAPMVNDAHHIVPTDGYVNGQRGSLPYGETNNASWTSQNGSKKGSSSVNGYSGTIFEPIDEYKGDFARIYFYMATRYQSQIDSWSSPMLNGTEDQAFENWALQMLLSWHENDPVSQKEIDRNNEVYDFQGNRNPFVDHPEYVACIWQNSCGNSNSPNLETSSSSIAYGSILYGSNPVLKSFTLTAENLSSDISISSNNTDFLLSSNSNGSFSSSLSISPDNSGIVNTTIYVAFEASENISQSVNGQLTISQAEIDNQFISLMAQTIAVVNTDIQISFIQDSTFTDVQSPTHTIQLQSNKKLDADLNVQLKLQNFENIFFPAQFQTDAEAVGTSLTVTMLSGDSIANLTINLDTAQLKTEMTKSFSIAIERDNAYLVEEPSSTYFEVEAFELVITAIKENRISNLSLAQNPISENLYFNQTFESFQFTIYDLSGIKILSGSKTSTDNINLRELKDGLYWIVLTDKKSGKSMASKFLKAN